MKWFLPLLPALLLGSCSLPSGHQAAALPDSAPRRILITEQAHGLVTRPGYRVVADLAGDTPEKRRFIDELWQRHHLSFPEKEMINYGPDSSFVEITFIHGRKQFTASSWHLVERQVPGLFASESGLGSLGNRTRAQALAAESDSYQRFRKSFDDIYDSVLKFTKTPRKPVAKRRAP